MLLLIGHYYLFLRIVHYHLYLVASQNGNELELEYFKQNKTMNSKERKPSLNMLPLHIVYLIFFINEYSVRVI